MAWKLYTDLVLIIYPHRVGELQGYIFILTEFSKDFHLQAVMRYNRDRRIKLAEKKRIYLTGSRTICGREALYCHGG
jgi:hypothetical protein